MICAYITERTFVEYAGSCCKRVFLYSVHFRHNKLPFRPIRDGIWVLLKIFLFPLRPCSVVHRLGPRLLAWGPRGVAFPSRADFAAGARSPAGCTGSRSPGDHLPRQKRIQSPWMSTCKRAIRSLNQYAMGKNMVFVTSLPPAFFSTF